MVANDDTYRGHHRGRPAVGDCHIVGRQCSSEANEHRTSRHLEATAGQVDIIQVETTAQRHVKVAREPLGVDRGAVAANDGDVVVMHLQLGAAEVVVHVFLQVNSDLPANGF